MALGRHQEEFSILEAVDHLSSMAEVGTEAKPSKIITINWLDPAQTSHNQEVVKRTFRVIHRYLEDLYEKNRPQLNEPETQRGIQAIMVLAKEAAQKLDRYTQLFKEIHGQQGVSRLKEYQSLQHFYLNKIMQKFQEEEAAIPLAPGDLKNLEAVRNDDHYELFLIKNEQGLPYFNRSLLAHIKLVGAADHLLSSTEAEDPFVRFRAIQDQDVHAGALEILELARPHIDEFYKEGMHLKDKGLVSSINKALMALMLTANTKNLASEKSCLSFYADFHFYLREALSSPAYSRLIAFPPEPSDHFSHMLINLAHALCCFFFFRIPRDTQTIAFIHQLIHRTEKSVGAEMWSMFLREDEDLRQKLKQFPHGPLVKTMESLQKQEETFDPAGQGNYPVQLFHFFQENMHVTLLRMPCPTKQSTINQAEIIPEFKGLIRYFKEANVRHLLINLQDRSDPLGEQARSLALEQLSQDEEFADSLTVIALPLDAEIPELLQQLSHFFPEAEQWSATLIEQMRRLLFDSKEPVTQEERQNFKTLFSLFLILKLVEIRACDSISFTSKDGLDASAAMDASFFSFLRLMGSGHPWAQEEKDFVLWMFYYFSLMVRERPIQPQPFKEAVSALAQLHTKLQEDREAIVAQFSKLYSDFDFLKIKIQRS